MHAHFFIVFFFPLTSSGMSKKNNKQTRRNLHQYDLQKEREAEKKREEIKKKKEASEKRKAARDDVRRKNYFTCI